MVSTKEMARFTSKSFMKMYSFLTVFVLLYTYSNVVWSTPYSIKIVNSLETTKIDPAHNVSAANQLTGVENPMCFMGNYCISYLITPKDHCKKNVQIRFLAFVLSGISNFEERMKVRQTWGNSTVFSATDVRVVFILGKGNKYTDLQEQLVKESNMYNDLVLADFRDNNESTTFKTLMGMHWTTRFCPNAKFVLKTDNDVFINTFAFLDVLKDMEMRGRTMNIITGFVWHKAWVRRSGKHAVSKAEYTPVYFPPYCDGSAYVMSKDVVSRLLKLAIIDKSKKFFPMEDVYITGILAAQAKIKPDRMNGWILQPSKFEMARWKHYLVWTDALKPSEKEGLWKILLALAGSPKEVSATTGKSISTDATREILAANRKPMLAGPTRIIAPTSKGIAATTRVPPTVVPFIRKPGCFIGKFCMEYLIKPKDHCKQGVKTMLLAIVLSGMKNSARRQRVRQTWGDRNLFSDTEVRVVFVLGKGKHFTGFEEKLRNESNTYNDMVIADFEDSYENLTLKTLFGLHWAANFCPDAQYVLKTDDDVLINTFQFLEIFNEREKDQKNNTNMIMGLLWKHAAVRRNGKYHVSRKNYGAKFYPDYCGGSGYIMSGDTVPKLVKLAIDDRSPTLLRMEDVYVTGVLAERAHIRPFMMNMNGWIVKPTKFYKNKWRNYLVWHGSLQSKQELEMWETLKRLAGQGSPIPSSTKPPTTVGNYIAYRTSLFQGSTFGSTTQGSTAQVTNKASTATGIFQASTAQVTIKVSTAAGIFQASTAPGTKQTTTQLTKSAQLA